MSGPVRPARRRRLRGRRVWASVVMVGMASLVGCAHPGAVTVGLLYPHALSQGPQGTEEERGARLAVEWANRHGGVNGKTIRVVSAAADRAEEVPAALSDLQQRGASIIVGSHGSAVSAVAAAEATRRHLLLWETGAVGDTDSAAAAGVNFIRAAPMGANLGRAAVDFVRDGLGPLVQNRQTHAGPMRWAVAYVDDAYGTAVGRGAVDEVAATGSTLVAAIPYTVRGYDAGGVAQRIAAAHPDVLFVSAYLDDGVAIRRALAAQHVPLLANLGTSSSYCLPEFGAQLGADAVGVFASDKPDAASVNTTALSPEGQATLTWFGQEYHRRFGVPASAHALSGFSNGLALFVHVLPRAAAVDPADVASTAMTVKLPVGTLANGGGLDIAPVGAPDAGNNRNAASVIWEWVAPGQRAVVWPPAFATHPVVALPLDG